MQQLQEVPYFSSTKGRGWNSKTQDGRQRLETGLGSAADTGSSSAGDGANWAVYLRRAGPGLGQGTWEGPNPYFPPFLFFIVDASPGLMTTPSPCSPAVRLAAWVPDHHAGESSVQTASQGSLGCPPQGGPRRICPGSCHPLVDTCGSAGGQCALLAACLLPFDPLMR